MVFDGREPSQFARKIKNLIKRKNQIYKDTPDPKYNHNCQFHFQYIQKTINTKIYQAKKNYNENMSHNLSNKNLNPKNFWSL